MPYIIGDNRSKYDTVNEKVMGLIPLSDPPMKQADKLASYASFLILEIKRISVPDLYYAPKYTTASGTDKKFREYAAELARTLPSNTEDMAGDLNYSLSSLCWGLCGDAPDRPSARYCMRSFIKGALWRAVTTQREHFNAEEYIFFFGVFTDVIDEMYRRRTANYEDSAIKKNGDLWENTK